jgi:uncharacterized protein YbaA (DUF1428 family)
LSDLYNQLVNNPAIEVEPVQIQTLYDDERDLNTTFGVNMGHYIDGFVLPVPCDCLNEYRRLAETVAKIWQEHGALDYREYVGDDLTLEGTRSFTDLVDATKADVIVFGWVVFESREARDLANTKVAADPRMADLIASSNSGFDAKKMAYGGFQPLVQLSNTSTG